jgi:hypothetical protein
MSELPKEEFEKKTGAKNPYLADVDGAAEAEAGGVDEGVLAQGGQDDLSEAEKARRRFEAQHGGGQNWEGPWLPPGADSGEDKTCFGEDVEPHFWVG